MNKEEKTTLNIKAPHHDFEVLKKHFSHCFDKSGCFDFEKFKKQLQSNTEPHSNFSKESYSLDWLGKSYARLLACDATTTLLKEDEEFNSKEENKDADNLLIKGDNLEVLKHLSNAYHEKIKMIYIDPPYNTGNDDFVYEDNRKFTAKQLSQLAGIEEEKAQRILDFTQSKSNSHSAWLTFMYPRLYIAKQLLTDDGVIFISIDDNEVAQLKLLMDEIFGEENFAVLAPRKTGAGSAATRSESELRKLNDYVFIYKKNQFVFKQKYIGEKTFEYSDENGNYLLAQFQASGSDATRSDRPKMYYPIYVLENETLTTKKPIKYKKCILPDKINGQDGRWLWSPDKFEQDKKFIYYREGDKLQRKVYYDPENDNNIYQSEKAWFENFTNASGTKIFNQLFDPQKGIFNNPKPIDLIKHLTNLIDVEVNEEIYILDFFAGSGTTGDAVMQLNAEDGGNRKYILVQIPEPIDPKKNQTAYNFIKEELKAEPTIFEITKERLIRAAKKIEIAHKEKIQNKAPLSETKDKLKKLKIGFKIFETIPIWENYDFEAEEFTNQLTLFDKGKLTDEDLKTLLTTWKTNDGILLTEALQKINVSSNYIAYYGYNKLYLLHTDFTTEDLKILLEKIDSDPNFNPHSIIAFGYHFNSKNLREIAENIKLYANKKHIDIDFITRY